MNVGTTDVLTIGLIETASVEITFHEFYRDRGMDRYIGPYLNSPTISRWQQGVDV